MLFDPKDPTGTLDLRLEAYEQIENRLTSFKGVVFSSIDESDLDDESTIEEELALLLLLVRQKSEELIMEEEDGQNWLAALIISSYFRGKAAAESELSAANVQAPTLHYRKHRLAVKKAMESFKGNIDLLTSQIEAIINDVPLRETTKEDLKAKIDDRIKKVGQTPLNRTTRTEIVYANQLAVITQGEAVEQATGVEVVYRWQTREDARVRDTHNARNKKLYEKKAVLPLLGEPNCRCRIIPVAVNESGFQATAFNPIFLTIPTLLTDSKLDDENEE